MVKWSTSHLLPTVTWLKCWLILLILAVKPLHVASLIGIFTSGVVIREGLALAHEYKSATIGEEEQFPMM